MTAIGDVEGRNVLIVDDMIDTAGTICMAANMLMERVHNYKEISSIFFH